MKNCSITVSFNTNHFHYQYKFTFFIFIILAFLLLIPETSYSQRSRRGLEQDTTLLPALPEKPKDTTDISVVSDTTAMVKDTIPPNSPLLVQGSQFIFTHPDMRRITKKDFTSINYTSLPDIISTLPDVFPLSTGLFGNLNHFSIYGSMPEDIEFSFNGRTISRLSQRFYNPSEFPVEFIENLELITGSDAVILSKNSTTLINLQSVLYNTAVPFTRLWFCEAGGDLMSADIVFSQNFTKNWNISLGIRREGSSGRYKSTNSDSWNVRALIRWNISELSNISLIENFTDYRIALNGGIDKANSTDLSGKTDIFNELWAKSYYENVMERNISNDLTLSYTSYLDKDTLTGIVSNFYFTYNNIFLDRTSDIYINENDTLKSFQTNNQMTGFNIRYENKSISFLKQRIGTSIDFYNSSKEYLNDVSRNLLYIAYYLGELNIDKNIIISGGIKGLFFENTLYKSLGSKIIYNADDNFEFGLDFSYQEKADFIEFTGNEKSHLFLAFFKTNSEIAQLNFNAFYKRNYNQPQYFLIYNSLKKPVTQERISTQDYDKLGMNLLIEKELETNMQLFGIGLFLKSIKINLINQFNYSKDPIHNEFILPLYRGIFIFSGNFISGKSSVNLGFKYSIFTKYNPPYLFQLSRMYIYNGEYQNTEPALLGIFLNANLGNAFIRLKYENLLNRNYYFLSIYPERSSHLQFSVSWSFHN